MKRRRGQTRGARHAAARSHRKPLRRRRIEIRLITPSAERRDGEAAGGGWSSTTYLLERRSMLLSGREKLERTVQVSDMLPQTRHHHGHSAARAEDTGGRQTPERASERASAVPPPSLSLSAQHAPLPP